VQRIGFSALDTYARANILVLPSENWELLMTLTSPVGFSRNLVLRSFIDIAAPMIVSRCRLEHSLYIKSLNSLMNWIPLGKPEEALLVALEAPVIVCKYSLRWTV
jgi:hypothetical protein